MKFALTTLLLIAMLLVPAVAQSDGVVPTVMMDGDHPALAFGCNRDKNHSSWYKVWLREDSEPVFVFHVRYLAWSFSAPGYLRVSATRLQFEPSQIDKKGDGFDFARADATVVHKSSDFHIVGGGRKYRFWMLEDPGPVAGGGTCLDAAGGVHAWLDFALNDFQGAEAKFKKLTASVIKPAPPPTPAPVQPSVGDLDAVVIPGSAQLYVDDEFRGTTSPEGHLVIRGLAVGAHTMRINLPGYKVFEQKLDISGGQTAEVRTTLQRNGPDPFKEEEIEDGLQKGVTPARMKELVEQIGVGFTMNDDIEKRLRALGADDALLYAIVKNKK
jgi:hypothetical protein